MHSFHPIDFVLLQDRLGLSCCPPSEELKIGMVFTMSLELKIGIVTFEKGYYLGFIDEIHIEFWKRKETLAIFGI